MQRCTTFLALGTTVNRFPVMNFLVGRQPPTRRKALITRRTVINIFTISVLCLVQNQTSPPRQLFVTHGTRMDFCDIRTFMHRKISFVCKSFVAQCTNKWFLPFVCSSVDDQLLFPVTRESTRCT